MIKSSQDFLPHCAYTCFVAALAVFWISPTASRVVYPDRLQERGTPLRRPIVPFRFRGHWSEDLAACGADPVDESQIWITARSLNFYEANGQVMRVTVENGRRVVVLLRSEGEGIIFKGKKGLVLSPDGEAVTVRDEDDTGSARFHRCHTKITPR